MDLGWRAASHVVLFLVVPSPGCAWEPLLKPVLQMRRLRPEKCLLQEHMLVHCRGRPEAQVSVPGGVRVLPSGPPGPRVCRGLRRCPRSCVCTFSPVLWRETLLILKSHCEVKLVQGHSPTSFCSSDNGKVLKKAILQRGLSHLAAAVGASPELL